MPSTILDGLSLVDTTGHLILATTLTCLALGIATNLFVRARYAGLEGDLRDGAAGGFRHAVLSLIVRDAEDAAARTREVNVQGIIEDRFQSELAPLLLGERFVKSATGLVIILGLLGTFYGLTLSIGRLVHLVSADAGAIADVSQAVTSGLTQALTGMAVAFSNSLVGILSAVVLTVLGVFSNVADRRTALMVQIETHVDRLLAARAPGPAAASPDRAAAAFGESVARLDGAVARFEQALQSLAADTRGLREFSVQIVAAKPRDGR